MIAFLELRTSLKLVIFLSAGILVYFVIGVLK